MTAQIVIMLALVIIATLTLTVAGIGIRNHVSEMKSGWRPASKNLRRPSHQSPLSGNDSHYRYDSRDVGRMIWNEFSNVQEAANESLALRLVSSIHAGRKVCEFNLLEMDYETLDLALEMLDEDWSAYFYGTLAIETLIDEEEDHLASLANDPRLERRYTERESHYEEDYPESHLAKKRKAAKRWLSYDGRPMCNKKLLADLINC